MKPPAGRICQGAEPCAFLDFLRDAPVASPPTIIGEWKIGGNGCRRRTASACISDPSQARRAAGRGSKPEIGMGIVGIAVHSRRGRSEPAPHLRCCFARRTRRVVSSGGGMHRPPRSPARGSSRARQTGHRDAGHRDTSEGRRVRAQSPAIATKRKRSAAQ